MRRPKGIVRFQAVIAASVAALVLAGGAFGAPARSSTAATVTVTFTDTTLHVSPATPQSGTTTFVVVNAGKKPHVLVITGPGLRGVRTAKVVAGKSAKLTVTLRPGAYELSDPVGLGVYNVQFLDIIQAATVSATGNSSVVSPPPTLPPMCGLNYTP